MNEQHVTPEQIMQVGLGFWASKTLLSAVELELFTKLAERPGSLADIRGRLGLHPRSARDFLDALVALGFLERRGGADGVYHNTPATDTFLDKKKPSYVGGILEMSNRRLFGFWNSLTEALKTGEAQNESKGGGESPFVALYADPVRLEGFLRAMTGISLPASGAIAAKFPWPRYKTFVDVGAAQGGTAAQIALAHPHLTGIGFDLPEVKPIFEKYAREQGLAGRLQFVAGDFFAEALPKADVIVMGHILHDWNVDEKKKLVRKAWEALPTGGAFIAYDSIIDDDRSRNAFGLLMSLNMLIETPGGFDYTGAECRAWMAEAGFRETSVEHLVGPDSMVVGIK